MASRNSAPIEPEEVQEILTASDSSAPKASPIEHIGWPKSKAVPSGHERTWSSEADGTSVASREGKAAQVVDGNRFSISSADPRPADVRPTPPDLILKDLSLDDDGNQPSPNPGPTDNSFLTAIAASERRVLELREELLHAEADLGRLKKQWAQHEARKKRHSAQSLTKLGPVRGGHARTRTEADTDGSNAWMHAEMERRKALMNQSRTGTRTVFAGSKHTRALSLLSSPQLREEEERSQQSSNYASSADITEDTAVSNLEKDQYRTRSQGRRMARASTTPNLAISPPESAPNERGIDGEVLLKTGKKMATDLRDGLWTFWEDLRQATVGEEASSGVNGRSQTSASTASQRLARAEARKSQTKLASEYPFGITVKRSSSSRTQGKSPSRARASIVASPAPALADPSFWAEHGITPLSQSPAHVKKAGPRSRGQPAAVPELHDDLAWDTWDESSPKAKSRKDSPPSSVASEANTLPTSVSESASPRVSTESSVLRSPEETTSARPIPWPSLPSLGPSTLRRTASNLMHEWDKAVTTDLEQQFSPGGDFHGGADEATTNNK